MIISRTPFRVSLFGGGSDYPAWYERHGGAFLACSIAHYCYVAARYRPPFFPEKHRVVWSYIEATNDLATLQHPAVRAVLPYLEIDRGMEIHHFADLPSRTGLGSSSAFTVGLLHALQRLQGHEPGPAQLAKEAIYVEQMLLAETVGIQDQIQTAHGGLNYVQIARDGSYSIRPVLMHYQRWQDFHARFLLFFTGISRTASTIAAGQVERIAAGESDLKALADMAARGVEILTGERDLDELGTMLNAAWEIKRGLSPDVSTPAIDEMYAAARKAGALGGKLLGAGGGGFLLVYARPNDHTAVRTALSRLLEVPFRVEHQGSRIVYAQ